MLIKFRQRIMGWLRAADYYPGGEQYVEESETQECDEPSNYRNGNHYGGKYGKANRGMKLGTSTANMAKQLACISTSREELNRGRNTLQFTVFPGSGGVAIQVQQYDAHTDDRLSTLHVIPEDKDLSEELAKIITLQSMRT